MTGEQAFVATAQGKLCAALWGAEHLRGRPPFLLLHDSLGCIALWRDFPARLTAATGRAVIAYDRLGFGRSDPRAGTMPKDFIRQEAEDGIWPVLDHFGCDQAILLGHSVGGAMAVCAGAKKPERAAAVITIAAQGFVEDKVISGIRAAQRDFAQPGQMDRLARYHGDKANWVFRAWVDTWLDQNFADWTLDADLRQLRAPLLALHGDRDEFGSLAHPRRFAALAQGPARAQILADCGHVPHREQPDALIAQIVDFVAA